MRSQRQLRVGEEMRHALATLFMRGDIPWPHGMKDMPDVTVTEVQVSPDLKNATVFVMPLGGQKLEETVRALNHIVGHFRHEVAQVITLRYTPKLRFAADNSFTYAQRIDDILHKPDVAKDLDKNEEE
jgi:ribosome-binding factor A